jgi:trans-L-3-hydroxyproline dehydratase
MYGALLVPPERADSDFGVLFMHNEGFSTMCGHGVLALGRAAVETGLVVVTEPETRIAMDTPAGQVHATVSVRDGRVEAVRFINVPSWVAALDARVSVPGLGEVRYDLAFGGAFYAYVDAEALGLRCSPGDRDGLVAAAAAIKAGVQESAPPEHPDDPDLGFLYGVIFTGPAGASGRGSRRHSRQVCVFADGEVDRSPTGTGVSGRLAILRRRGEVGVGEWIVIESIIGTRFRCRIVEETRVHGIAAVVPEVSGRCWVTGWSTHHIDPADPLRNGFLVRRGSGAGGPGPDPDPGGS